MLKTLDENLKFTMEIGGNCFLDLKISIQSNRLETNVHSKPTDSHFYVEASSCHEKSSKNDIKAFPCVYVECVPQWRI